MKRLLAVLIAATVSAFALAPVAQASPTSVASVGALFHGRGYGSYGRGGYAGRGYGGYYGRGYGYGGYYGRGYGYGHRTYARAYYGGGYGGGYGGYYGGSYGGCYSYPSYAYYYTPRCTYAPAYYSYPSYGYSYYRGCSPRVSFGISFGW